MTTGEGTNELGMHGEKKRMLERGTVMIFKPIAGCCRLCISINAARSLTLKL